MQAMRGEGKFGGSLKYVLFTFLGMAVGGLVLGSFSGGGNVSSNDVAKIGDKSINIESFDKVLQRSISRYGISRQQAYKIGMADDVLAGEVRSYFLLNEAEDMGIEISKDQLSKRIAQVIKPYAKDGQSLQETLDMLLRRQGMSEKEFILGIKKEMSGEIIMKAIKTGFSPSTDLLANDLYMFQTQTRDIDIILFPDSNITNIEPATKEQLERLYNAVKLKEYKIPEYRSVKVATFDTSKVDITFSVPDEDVRSAYDNNQKSFRIGEQLVLSQIVTKEKMQADEIYALTKEGLSLKAAVIKIMGKDATYIEGVNFETSMMLPDLMDALKDREINKIVAPVKTMLGYHIVKLDNILAPSIRPFNEVRSQIKRELLEAKKADYFYGISSDFDAMLNDEMSLEDIAKEIDIEISSIDFIDSNGLNKLGNDALESFDDRDKAEISTIIFEIEGDIASSMQDFGSKLVAFAITSKEESTFKPFDSVEKELAEQFIADMRRSENELLMQKYLAELDTKGSSFDSIAADNNLKIEKISDISINKEASAPLNANTLPLIFQTTFGGYQTLRLDGQSALIKISGYGFINQDDNVLRDKNVSDIKTRLVQEGKEEAFLVYLHALSNKHRATINNRLLERAYGESDSGS